jgi:hypothetical protein
MRFLSFFALLFLFALPLHAAQEVVTEKHRQLIDQALGEALQEITTRYGGDVDLEACPAVDPIRKTAINFSLQKDGIEKAYMETIAALKAAPLSRALTLLKDSANADDLKLYTSRLTALRDEEYQKMNIRPEGLLVDCMGAQLSSTEAEDLLSYMKSMETGRTPNDAETIVRQKYVELKGGYYRSILSLAARSLAAAHQQVRERMAKEMDKAVQEERAYLRDCPTADCVRQELSCDPATSLCANRTIYPVGYHGSRKEKPMEWR